MCSLLGILLHNRRWGSCWLGPGMALIEILGISSCEMLPIIKRLMPKASDPCEYSDSPQLATLVCKQ